MENWNHSNNNKNQKTVSNWYRENILPIITKVDRNVLELSEAYFFKNLRFMLRDKVSEDEIHTSLNITESLLDLSSKRVVDTINNVYLSIYNQANFRIHEGDGKLSAIYDTIVTNTTIYLSEVYETFHNLEKSTSILETQSGINNFLDKTKNIPEILEFEAIAILFK